MDVFLANRFLKIPSRRPRVSAFPHIAEAGSTR